MTVIVASSCYEGTNLYLYTENPSSPTPPVTIGTNAIAMLQGAQAIANDSLAIGVQSYTHTKGSMVFANGRFGTSGDCQNGKYLLRNITASNLFTDLYVDGVGGSTKLVLPDDSTWTFIIHVTGHRTDVDDGHAGFKAEGVIYRGSGAATTAFQGSVSTSVISRSNAQWNINIIANTASGSLDVQVKGQSGKIIRWAGLIQTIEVKN